MIFQNPITSIPPPHFSEGSAQRSLRDSSANNRQWTKNRVINQNQEHLAKAVESLSIQVEKIRRRIVGGGGSTTPTATGTFTGEWSNVQAYTAQQWFVVSTGPIAGTYVCVSDAPAGTTPDTGYPYFIKLPLGSLGKWL